jgi:crossover junction endodeoxyribonuclease RusA
MLPFEFTVAGPPLSHQTRNRAKLQVWRETVRARANQRWPQGDPPSATAVKIIVSYYHDGPAVRIDNDNLLKPIQDALNGLVYEDDSLITDTISRKTNLDGRFRVRGMSPVLAEGFCTGEEFLHIRIEAAPDHGVLP